MFVYFYLYKKYLSFKNQKIQKDNKFLEIPRDYIIYKNEDIRNKNM